MKTPDEERSADWLRQRIGVPEPSSAPPEPAPASPKIDLPPAPPAPTASTEEESILPKLRPGEIDLLVAPLPYEDDRHRFENALRRLPGVRETTGLYVRRGVYRIRVSYLGGGRLSQQLRVLKGFRMRILAEDRRVVQVLIEGEALSPA